MDVLAVLVLEYSFTRGKQIGRAGRRQRCLELFWDRWSTRDLNYIL